MTDSDKKSSIPLWQQQNSSTPPSTDDKDKDTGKDTARSTLIEQASKFLEDESIKDATIDRKIAFLETKGLTSPEIDSLLGVSRNLEASSDSHSSTEEDKVTTASVTENPAPTLPTPSTSSHLTPTTAPSNNSAPRDVPPIITYPEFLLHQSKPPPLVTLRSVLYTLYGAAGLGATFYTASEYIVKPMLANLTDARHDLASATEENLKKLNEKLEQNVSQIPPSLLSTKPITSSAQGDIPEEEDTESITSDPTELFHRDIGTQTTQDLSNPLSSTTANTSSNTGQDSEPPTPSSTALTHQKRLEQIGSQLREFADTQTTSSTLHDTTRSRVSDLQRYLDGLLYSKSSSYPYSATTGYGMYSTPGLDSGGGAATGVAKGEEDAISNFRAEIRGVKGALLSARNFPSGRGGLRASSVR
ncbi:peroxisomal membrane anchor protein conserved region-domain-containing protein [Aspergillus pseudoustus]|uniref:Peroxisomal membrane protein PEX14 n=1 Tax=Aspergillus pseudoustus TaxID=1810923 RepID=A0ABR4IM37_9EURO